MDIQIGKCYKNKTLLYLVPALNYYGPTLKLKINSISKLGFGIFDTLLEGSYLENQKNIYMLIDKLVDAKKAQDFIRWIKLQEYYVTDYEPNALNTTYQREHMIVLAFPTQLQDCYDKFLKGKYSKMYTKEELGTFFDSKVEALNVLSRTKHAQNNFKNIIKEHFDVKLEDNHLSSNYFEYELPLKKEEEYFKYKLVIN